jgi:hypothetical protein
MPAVVDQGRCCSVGCNHTGTIVQAGSRVEEDFRKGDHITVFTCSVGKKDGYVAKDTGYHNKWGRVNWQM